MTDDRSDIIIVRAGDTIIVGAGVSPIVRLLLGNSNEHGFLLGSDMHHS